MMVEDRILYNKDVPGYPPESIDEVVMYNCTMHLEQLDDSVFMLIGDNGIHRWHLRIASRSGRAKVDAWMLDDESPKPTHSEIFKEIREHLLSKGINPDEWPDSIK